MLWFASPLAFAATVDLQLQPDKLTVSQVGVAEVLVIADIGERLDGLAPPTLPVGSGLRAELVSQGRTNVTSGGRIRSVARYSFDVVALEAGDWTVGPAEVEVGIRRLRSVARSLNVEKKSATAIAQDPFTASAGFSTETAWEGQTILFQTRVEGAPGQPMVGGKWRLPEFKGLRQLPDIPEQNQQLQVKSPEGTVMISESSIPLVVTGTGDKSVTGAFVTLAIPTGRRNFFGAETKAEHLAVPTSKLFAKALPEAPPNFSGLVGDYRLESYLNDKAASVGVPLKWSLLLTGDGLTEGFQVEAPDVPGASVYPSGTDTRNGLRQGKFVGEAAAAFDLVPTSPGTLEVPPFEVVVFSPSEGTYVRLRTDPLLVEVEGDSEDGGALKSFAPDGEPEGEGEAVAVDPFLARATWGAASAPSMASALPVMGAMAALPGGLVMLGWGWGWARQLLPQRQRRQTSVEEQVKAGLRAELTIQQLHRLVSMAMNHRPSDELSEAARRLAKVRFGGDEQGDAATLLEVRQVLEAWCAL